MSATASSWIKCPTLQSELNANWKNAHSVREPLPFLEFLLSPANRQPVTDMVVQRGSGKIRNVELVYDQRILESAVSSNQENPKCTASTKRSDKSTTYTIDANKNLQIEEYFDIQDLNTKCADDNTFILNRIQQNIDALMRKVATVSATEAVALTGKWASDVTVNGSNEYEVKTLKTGSTDEMYAFTMSKIDTAMAKTGFTNGLIIGGTTLHEYYKQLQAGCCSSQGIDLAKIFSLYGKAVVWDRRVKTALGSDDKALVAELGALQLLNFNQFEGLEGVKALDTPDYKRMVIRDPMTGFPIDMVYKDDCGKIQMIFTATTKVVALPSDLFASGDTYEGVNYVSKIKVVNA